MADSDPGFGKKILSFFIKDIDEPAKPVSANAPVANQPASPAAPASKNDIAGNVETDRKFVEHFAALLEKANLPGPDYFEYKQVLQNMDELGLNEEKQFQAAWASFKAMGNVKDAAILKTSADQYLAILDKDRASFLQDVDKAIKDRVGALQDEQKKLENSNVTLAQQIDSLQKEIDKNKSRLGQISGEVSEQSARITANRDRFEVTYTSFVEQIKSDQLKIGKYIK
jgi:hypothetical protein